MLLVKLIPRVRLSVRCGKLKVRNKNIYIILMSDLNENKQTTNELVSDLISSINTVPLIALTGAVISGIIFWNK
jgi:hypothetical protein